MKPGVEKKSYSFLKKPASSARGRPGGLAGRQGGVGLASARGGGVRGLSPVPGASAVIPGGRPPEQFLSGATAQSSTQPVYEVESDDERCSDAEGESGAESRASSAETAIVLSSPEDNPESETRTTFNLRKLSDALSNISQQDIDELDELESAIREGESVDVKASSYLRDVEPAPLERRVVSAEVAGALRMLIAPSSSIRVEGSPSTSAPQGSVSGDVLRKTLRRHRGLQDHERPIYERILERRKARDEELLRLSAEVEEGAARSRIGSRRLSPSEATRIVSRLQYYGERKERHLQTLQEQKAKDEADELSRQGRPQISRKSRTLTKGRAPLLERLTRSQKYPPPAHVDKEDAEATFRPVINSTSRALSHGPRGPSQLLAWEKKKQFRMQQALEEAAEEEMRECSFTPAISQHSRKLAKGRTMRTAASFAPMNGTHRLHPPPLHRTSPPSAAPVRADRKSARLAVATNTGTGSPVGADDSSDFVADISTVIAYDERYDDLFGELITERISM